MILPPVASRCFLSNSGGFKLDFISRAISLDNLSVSVSSSSSFISSFNFLACSSYFFNSSFICCIFFLSSSEKFFFSFFCFPFNSSNSFLNFSSFNSSSFFPPKTLLISSSTICFANLLSKKANLFFKSYKRFNEGKLYLCFLIRSNLGFINSLTSFLISSGVILTPIPETFSNSLVSISSSPFLRK